MTRGARDLREYAEDGALVLGGAAAILLQIASPVVGAGVAAHSAFASDPMRRLRHTLSYVYAVTLSPDELAGIAARFVDRAHEGVPGARDPEHQLWVAATLYRVGVDLHERLHGPLAPHVADAVYAANARLGTALQLPPDAWPADRAAFERYWSASIPRLRVTEEARRVAAELLHSRGIPWWARAGMPAVRVLTAGLLPASVREQFGMRLRPRAFALTLGAVRLLVRLAPRRLRALPSRRLLAALREHAG